MSIEGIPEGWELVRVGKPIMNVDCVVAGDGMPVLIDWITDRRNWLIIRKIEKPKTYRAFANAAEYFANRRENLAVDWSSNDPSPGFFAVVSANNSFIWVAFGDVIQRFDWSQAFEKLIFRHVDNTTSPFGVEVTE